MLEVAYLLNRLVRDNSTCLRQDQDRQHSITGFLSPGIYYSFSERIDFEHFPAKEPKKRDLTFLHFIVTLSGVEAQDR